MDHVSLTYLHKIHLTELFQTWWAKDVKYTYDVLMVKMSK